MVKVTKKRLSLLYVAVVMVMSPVSAQQQQRRMTVSELFELVENNSKSLLTQKTGAEVADQAVASAKSQRLPDINTSLSFSYIGNALITDRDFSNVHGLSSPHFGNSFALEAQQVVYAGGALDAGVRLAQLQKQQADVSTSLTRQQLRFMALGQYLDIYKIINRMKVYESNIALTARLIDDIRQKQRQGMALKNDVTRYELQMETLKLELTKLRNQRTILNHQLCNTLGLAADTQIQPDETIINNVYAQDGEGKWQTEALVSSPALQQSVLNMQIARENEKLAKSDLLPKVALVAVDNFDGPILFELPPVNNNLNIWYVGVGVKYSLGSLFKSNKKVRQAAVAARQSQEAHAVTVENINNAVQAAYTGYQQSYVELETQQKSVQLATQNYQVISERYLSQLALITDMIDASNIKLNAELQEVDARINITYAYYKIQYVAGKI